MNSHRNLMALLILASLSATAYALTADPELSKIDEWTHGCIDGNNASDCWYLGEHEMRLGTEEKALEWYQKECEIDPYDGCGPFADLILKRGDKDKAIELYTKECNYKEENGRRYDGMKGYGGCVAMGFISYQEKDFSAAANWFKRACEEKQFINSCYKLKEDPNLIPYAPQSGFPVGMGLIATKAQDYRKAAYWFKRACEEEKCQDCCDALKSNPNLTPYADQ